MQSARTKAEQQQHKNKLAHSYAELLSEFGATDLRHVGNYTLGKLIGTGSFGKVYLARHDLIHRSKVVLKASKKNDSNLAREIHHHRQFIHPHIARLYEVIVTETTVWLVLEFCAGDELYNHLLETGPIPIDNAQKIFAQLVGAVAYIHSKSCVHRDLKLENVLLDKNGNVKLCDFGFTREYEGKANYLSTFCGTICYSAPEMLKGEKYAGEKVDVWSLGIILYALLRGGLPFDEDDDQATKAKILKDEPDYPESIFPEAAKNLISKMLSKRPLYRPSLADVLADPFLTDHAPQQQAILKLSQPAPFTTAIEKATLERMKSTGVDIDKVIENVLSQRCDSLAGWWSLSIDREQKKEMRREKKRKEKEAEMKLLRRLSAASSRLDKLEGVAEEGDGSTGMRKRSLSRGRSQRRSTPQILITDLPKLPEGTALGSPGNTTPPPPPPIDKDSVRSRSDSRPPIPPKERKRRSSNLQLVTTNPDLLGPTNGVTKRRKGRKGHNHFLHSLAVIKHWFMDSTKITKSPKKTVDAEKAISSPSTLKATSTTANGAPTFNGHNRDISGASVATRSSYSASFTPLSSGLIAGGPRTDTRVRSRNSVSPITSRAGNYRHGHGGSTGLRGRKSTSSSVSSARSLPRHSKTSSVSSNSLDTINSPTRSIGRSPHSSIKVLPTTPTANHFPNNIRFVRDSTVSSDSLGYHATRNSWGDDLSAALSGGSSTSSVMFARRKKSPFRGPTINSSYGSVPAPHGSPTLRARESSATHLNLGLKDLPAKSKSTLGRSPQKSQIIEEEDEDEIKEQEEDDDIEEVDYFEPIDLRRGERVHSIIILDDPADKNHDSKEQQDEEGEDDVPDLPIKSNISPV